MKISRSKSLLVLLMALVCSVAAWAEDLSMAVVDSIPVSMADSISDPEWYVAPLDYDSVIGKHRVPRRAAANCPTDSVLTFDVDSNLIAVSVYEYGDTTRTIIWDVNPDGSRVGQSKEETATTDLVSYAASYDWDDNTNNWKGISKTVYIYNASHKMESNTAYVWVNGAWTPDARYVYTYDTADREIEYVYYTRNTTTNELMPNISRIQGWSSTSQKILEINYTAYDGTAWIAGNKKEWGYDVSGNKIEYSYYSAYSSGDWVNSTHEIWQYNGSNRETYYKKDTWTAGAWKTTSEEYKGYDAYGNINSLERYSLKNGSLAGTMKEEYVYNADGEQTCLISYKWTNGEWVYNIRVIDEFDNDGNEIEICRYSWKNDAWVGTGTRTLNTYASGRLVEVITQNWPTNATDWVNSTRLTYEYSGSKKIHEASYVWQSDQWQGENRTDYHYTSNRNDTIWRYTFETDWVYSERVVNTFDAKGTNIMVHNALWNGSAWVMSSMTRTDLVYDASNRQTLKATWSCEADSVWVGGTKDTTAYSAFGKQIYTARYTYDSSISDWKPSSKTETDYDSANRQTDKRVYSWNTSTNSWKGTSRTETVYDEKGNKVVEATYNGWIAATNSWKGNKKTEKVYDINNLVISMVLSNWNTTTNTWKFTTRYTYFYDDSRREILQTVENYTNNDWTNTNKYEKEYNGSKLIKNNTYQWLNGQWLFSARIENYYDDDVQAKLRRQITGSWKNGVLSSFADKLYAYSCDFQPYLIRFVNYDGTELQSNELKQGATPAYTGETPNKPSTGQYTYTFTGWDPEIVLVTGDATYTAQYDSVVNTYTVTFKNGDQVLQSAEVEYGTTPEYTGTTPTKEATAQYTYEFAGWDTELVPVAGEATYNATFSSTVNTYLITFKNGEDVLQSAEVEYGTTPEYTGTTPTKEATAQYTYEFAGWDAELVPVTGEATYNATFSSTVNTYLITFKNGDETLQSTQVEYGEMPAYNGETPTKPSDDQYSYVFAGWDPEIALVTGTATYNATFTATTKTYTVTWRYPDGTEIDHESMEYGVTPTHADVTKAATAQYTYTFIGWSPSIATVTGNATYTAQFDSVINTYTIIFNFEDGTELDRVTVAYGEIPATSLTPASTHSDDQYTYTFAGWTPEIVPVTGNATYTAVYTRVLNQYTVTFKNYNNQILQSVKFDYGTMPEYTGETPTKPATTQYTYEFTGWTPELDTVKANATYTAVFKSVIRTFTILFLDEDGETVLDNVTVEYGQKPVYTGATPTKPDDEQYTYTFAGWTPMIVAATADATYTATYTATPISHEAIENVNSSSLQGGERGRLVLLDGVIYILCGDKTYTLDGRMNDSSSW